METTKTAAKSPEVVAYTKQRNRVAKEATILIQYYELIEFLAALRCLQAFCSFPILLVLTPSLQHLCRDYGEIFL